MRLVAMTQGEEGGGCTATENVKAWFLGLWAFALLSLVLCASAFGCCAWPFCDLQP